MSFLGDYPEDYPAVPVFFSTHDGNGGAVAASGTFETADFKIYKDGSTTAKATTNGLTINNSHNSITGLYSLVIDTSNDTGDAAFWVAGHAYSVILSPDTETVNSQVVVKHLGTFTLAMNMRPATLGRNPVVDANGLIDATTVKVGPTGAGTAQTAVDLGSFVFKKNTALAGFPFPMKDSTTHLPKTGLTVTATRSIDGAAFAACANAVSETSGGNYKIDLAASDLNGDTVALRFTATGADQLDLTVVTN